MQGEKNFKKIKERWLQIASIISHLLQEGKGGRFTARMIVFETSILFSILRSFYRGGLVHSWLNDTINIISSLSLHQRQGQQFDQVIADIVRISVFILHCSVLTLTFILGSLRLGQLHRKYLQNTLSKQLEILLFFTIPILLFSTKQVTSFQNYATVTFDLLNIIFSLTLSYFIEAISGQVEYGRNISTKVTFGQNSSGLKCIKSLLSCTLIIIDGRRSNIFMLAMLTVLIVSLYQLNLILKYPKYIAAIYQKITEIRVSITISLAVLTFLITATGQSYLCKNAEILFLILSILLYTTFAGYQKHKRNVMLIEGVEKIEDQIKAIAYVLQLIKLQQHEEQDPQSGLIISLILKNHADQCMKEACICRSRLNLMTRRKLLKEVILDHIQIIIKAFPVSFELKFISLGYELANSDKIINASLEVHKLLRVAKIRKMPFREYFLLKELQYVIHQKFADDGEGKSIHCQNIFKEDVIKFQVSQDLRQLVDLNLRKYRILAVDCSSLNKIEEQAIAINRFILKVQQSWAYIRSIGSFSFQIHQIFIFYFQNVIPSPIQTREFIKEISTKLQKVRALRGVCRESINKYLYSKKTCIIESNILESFGTIQNITVNCNEVLGFPKDRLLKRSISDIMPQFFANGHQSVITSWLQRGAAPSQVADMVDFGYVDTKLVCFKGYLFLKVHSDGHRLLFYATLIRENDNDYLLLNSRLEIQGIGKRLVKEGIFVKGHIRQSITEYTQLNTERLPLGKTLRTTINLQNLFNTPELYSAFEQSHSHCNYNPNLLKFQSSIAMTRYKISQDEYFLVKFQNIKKWLSSTKSMYESKSIGRSKKDERLPANTTLSHLNQDILLQEQYDSVDPAITNHIKFSQLFKTQVTTKSSIHDQPSNQVTFYSNFTLNVKNCFTDPSKIPMGLYKKTTIFLFAVCTILIFQFFSLRTIFVVGFQSFNDVMFGDGAVSDNNQMLQILYNNILMSKVYCGMQRNGERCDYLLTSTKQISNILYKLYVSDVQVFLRNRTALTDLKYYGSYDIEVPFTVGRTIKNISTLQFMEYYYFAISQHYNFLNGSGNLTQKEGDQAMQILIDNWRQMKFINHNAISFYLDAGSKELDLLMVYLLTLTAGLNIFLLLLAGGLYYSDSVQAGQKYGVYSIYGHMNATMIKDLINHYISIKQCIVTERFRPCEMMINSEAHDSSHKKLQYNRNSCCVFYIVILWMVLMILGGLEMLQVELILQPSRKMVLSINDLMDSENYLLESYFQLKTYYLQYDFKKSVDEISLELSRVLSQPESDFTKTAKKSIDLFSSDPSFIEDFNNLLTENVCYLTAPLFSPQDVDYCNNNFTYSTLSLGLVSSMTFFQRNSYTALKELQRRQNEAVNKTEYFTRRVFQDIDDSIFYMFRLYQATQARMYQGLNYSVNNSLLLLDFLNSCAVTVFLLLLGWWLASFRTHRKVMMQLYGAVLQFPQVVMKKMVVQDVISRLGMQF